MTRDLDAQQHTALASLLSSLFKSDELRRWLYVLDRGPELVQNLPGEGVSDAKVMHEAAGALIRRGVNGRLFSELRRERPGKSDAINQIAALFNCLPMHGELPVLLQRELKRVFQVQAIRRTTPVSRSLRDGRGGPERASADLRSFIAPGLNLLVGEQGLGKSSLLFQLGKAAQAEGAVVLAVRGAVNLGQSLGSIAYEAGLAVEEVGRRITLVLWDDFEVNSDVLDGIIDLPDLLPNAQALAGCSPIHLRRIFDNGLAEYPRWTLLPMKLTEARNLLVVRGHDPALIDSFAQALGESCHSLIGNPLFIECAAELEARSLPPQLPRVVSRHIEERTERLGIRKQQATALMLTLAQRFIIDRHPVTAAQLSALPCMDGVDVPGLLDALTHQQLICVAQDHWYEFPHILLPYVLLARDCAERRAFVRAGHTCGSDEREIALLSVMFARPALDAMYHVAPNNDGERLRAIALLPHEEIPPAELARAIREMVPLGDVERDSDALSRCVEGLKQDLNPTEATGLLRALVRLESRDPEFLGLLLVLIDKLGLENEAAASLLRGKLLSHLPLAPTRPATCPVSVPGRRIQLARFAVSWADLWQAFPGHQAQGQEPDLPATRLSWLAASVFAGWWGARLPTNEEWNAAAKAMCRDTDDWQVAHLPRTHADLVADGPIRVDDPRLVRDPGLKTWRQLIGNVREWCSDGPDGAPQRAYARGGSFQRVDTSADRSVGRLSLREDVGLRLCWDDA